MAEYIEREAAIYAIAHRPHVKGWDDYEDGICRGLEEAEKALASIPAANVQPVRRGRWIFGTTMHHDWMKCSECLVSQDVSGCFSYCPNCGARLDL